MPGFVATNSVPDGNGSRANEKRVTTVETAFIAAFSKSVSTTLGSKQDSY